VASFFPFAPAGAEKNVDTAGWPVVMFWRTRRDTSELDRLGLVPATGAIKIQAED